MNNEQIRDFIGRQMGYYQASPILQKRRDMQIIALVEVLRFMDGDTRMSDQIEDYVPLTLADIPTRLGGVTEDADA